MAKERKDNRNRVALIGSTIYEDKLKIKEFIYKLKEEFKNNLVIVSGGRNNGADKHIKKYTLESGCDYLEFNPAHTDHNLYSALHENYYLKPYSPIHFFQRNKLMLNYVDSLVIFRYDTDTNNKDIESVIQEAKRQNIKYVIIN